MHKIKNLFGYLITFLIWVLIFYLIETTKNNAGILSIDSIITIITLLSLMFQNLKINEITLLQDKIVHNISIESFTRRSSHIFYIIFAILPVLSYELKDYFSDKAQEYDKLSKSFIFLSLIYAILMQIFSYTGKQIDNDTKNDLNRKYGVWYGILCFLYITIKYVATA